MIARGSSPGQSRLRRLRRLARPAGLAVLAVTVAGCMPAGATTQGQSIHGLYTIFFGAAAFVWLLVSGLITWSIFRYRHRGAKPVHEVPLPPQYHGNLVLEAIWTGLPILTVIGLFILTLGTLNFVQADPPQPLEVHVTAFQWQWKFDYTGTNVTVIGSASQIPQFIVPVNEDVHVTLTSADVNHAFWVPAFLFKKDAIPGLTNQFDFKVTQAGSYRGQCAEFCGMYHDEMIFDVKAVPAAEFTAWLQAQEKASNASPSASAPPSGSPAPVPSLGSPLPTKSS